MATQEDSLSDMVRRFRVEHATVRDEHSNAVARLEGGFDLHAHLNETAMNVSEMKAQERVVAAVAQKMRMRVTVRCLRAWQDAVAREITGRETMRKAIRRIRSLTCASAMSAWISLVSEAQRAASLTQLERAGLQVSQHERELTGLRSSATSVLARSTARSACCNALRTHESRQQLNALRARAQHSDKLASTVSE